MTFSYGSNDINNPIKQAMVKFDENEYQINGESIKNIKFKVKQSKDSDIIMEMKENNYNHKSVSPQRESEIDQAIMQIFTKRNTVGHYQLMITLVKQLSFLPSEMETNVIKRKIREYLQSGQLLRDSDNHRLYHLNISNLGSGS